MLKLIHLHCNLPTAVPAWQHLLHIHMLFAVCGVTTPQSEAGWHQHGLGRSAAVLKLIHMHCNLPTAVSAWQHLLHIQMLYAVCGVTTPQSEAGWHQHGPGRSAAVLKLIHMHCNLPTAVPAWQHLLHIHMLYAVCGVIAPQSEALKLMRCGTTFPGTSMALADLLQC